MTGAAASQDRLPHVYECNYCMECQVGQSPSGQPAGSASAAALGSKPPSRRRSAAQALPRRTILQQTDGLGDDEEQDQPLGDERDSNGRSVAAGEFGNRARRRNGGGPQGGAVNQQAGPGGRSGAYLNRRRRQRRFGGRPEDDLPAGGAGDTGEAVRTPAPMRTAPAGGIPANDPSWMEPNSYAPDPAFYRAKQQLPNCTRCYGCNMQLISMKDSSIRFLGQDFPGGPLGSSTRRIFQVSPRDDHIWLWVFMQLRIC